MLLCVARAVIIPEEYCCDKFQVHREAEQWGRAGLQSGDQADTSESVSVGGGGNS